MVHSNGRSSGGCANCRQAKKGCDQKRPTCSRCRRLHQACHGYNETGTTSSYDQSTELDLAATTRPIRAGTHDMSTSVDFFEQQFYTRYTCFIKYFKQHEIVAKLMSACSLSVLDARGLVKRDDTTVMSLYVDILGAVGGRIRNPQTAMEDATVVATILLYLLERLQGRQSRSHPHGWKVHIDALAHLIDIRGVTQVRTKIGKAVFREARRMVVHNALDKGTEAPPWVICYTQAIHAESAYSLHDQLAILEARATRLRSDMLQRDAGTELLDMADTLEQDMKQWADVTRMTLPDLVQFTAATNLCTALGGHRARSIDPDALDDHRPWIDWYSCYDIVTDIQGTLRGRAMALKPDRPGAVPSPRNDGTLVCLSLAAIFEMSTSAQLGSISRVLDLVRPFGTAMASLQRKQDTAAGELLAMLVKPLWQPRPANLPGLVNWLREQLEYIAKSLGDLYAEEVLEVLDQLNSQSR